jgi:lysophospholipase L1-like esterase
MTIFITRHKRASLKIILFAAVFIISWLIAEWAVESFCSFRQVVEVTFKGNRVTGEEAMFKISPDKILLYEWKNFPQQVILDKPENVFRIVVLGDSVTNSHFPGWRLQEYYPAVLQDLLNSRQSRQTYEVINAGVPGYNTQQEAEYLQNKWKDYNPEMVILGYCAANDRAVRRKIIQHKEGVYCSDVRENYPFVRVFPYGMSEFLMRKSAIFRLVNLLLVESAYKNNWKAVLNRIEYFDRSSETKDAIKKIQKICSKADIDLLVVIFPRLDFQNSEETDWIVNVCREQGVNYISCYEIFKDTGFEKLKVSAKDICHPNKLGHRLVAQRIFRHIMESKNAYR